MGEKLTPQAQDFAEWYNQVVQRTDLADYSPVRGSMIMPPYGMALWENIHAYLDRRFKEKGIGNAYFPLFIPQSFIEKESQHIEGFSPELAIVTYAGGEELEEKLAVRPTSETIIADWVRKRVHSYRDLPLLLNCWNNVVRWELRTRLFMRTAEFLWQEGHTSHATLEEADLFARAMLQVYLEFEEQEAAMSPLAGSKSEAEKFAGAHTSYTLEALMGDRRALQTCTSHNLGDNFARAFGIQYLDRTNQLQYAWQTSWGMSWRIIGGIVMTHGDDKGLKLPPRLAPIQVVIVPIYRKESEQAVVLQTVEQIRGALGGLRIHVDMREGLTAGFKFNDWEMRGVPLRLEVGPKDVEANRVVLVRRDTGTKEMTAIEQVGVRAAELLVEIQEGLHAASVKFREQNSFTVDSLDEFKQRTGVDGGAGFLLAHWCGKPSCERSIQEQTKATIRVIPFEQAKEAGRCIVDGEPSGGRVAFGKAY